MNRDAAVAIQWIYTQFRERGAEWPTFVHFERWLNRYRKQDAVQVINRIPAEFLEPLTFLEDRPDPRGKLILTAQGWRRCLGCDDDEQNFIDAIQCLVRHDTNYDLAEDPTANRVPISSKQLADELNLPRLTDPNSLKRLLALLEVEGLVTSDEHS
jgi:hypothetical protein